MVGYYREALNWLDGTLKITLLWIPDYRNIETNKRAGRLEMCGSAEFSLRSAVDCQVRKLLILLLTSNSKTSSFVLDQGRFGYPKTKLDAGASGPDDTALR